MVALACCVMALTQLRPSSGPAPVHCEPAPVDVKALKQENNTYYTLESSNVMGYFLIACLSLGGMTCWGEIAYCSRFKFVDCCQYCTDFPALRYILLSKNIFNQGQV